MDLDTTKIFGEIPNDITVELSTSDKIKSMYGDRSELIKGILSMYKFIFASEEKQIWQKTGSDVSDDIASAKYNLDLDTVVKETYAAIDNIEHADSLFNRKTTMIAPLIDFCYIYYTTYYNADAPLYKLPSGRFKFTLIMNVLHCANTTLDKNIQQSFISIINSQLFTELRNEKIPFYLSSSMSIEEQREAFKTVVKPCLNILLCDLLRLDKIPTDVIERLDNLDHDADMTGVHASVNDVVDMTDVHASVNTDMAGING